MENLPESSSSSRTQKSLSLMVHSSSDGSVVCKEESQRRTGGREAANVRVMPWCASACPELATAMLPGCAPTRRESRGCQCHDDRRLSSATHFLGRLYAASSVHAATVLLPEWTFAK